MAYNFGIINVVGFGKAAQWLKGHFGNYFGGKPPIDNAYDNNYQEYTDNAQGIGALPTAKSCNALNQMEITIGQCVVDGEYRPGQTSAPAAPVIAQGGAAGSTNYTYAVVARGGSLQAASATTQTTTGNATLSSANYNVITWTPVLGANYYDIYRTAGGATQGLIGTVPGGFRSANVVLTGTGAATISFSDTGLTGDGSTLPSVNTTGAEAGSSVAYGVGALLSLAAPATPLIANLGTAGSTTYTYKVVARGGWPGNPVGASAASGAGSTATGNATLSASNANTITWQPVPGAASYDVYRTVGGATTGKIGNVSDTNTLTDTGLTGDTTTPPSTNNTGTFVSQGPALENLVDNAVSSSATVTANNMINGILRVTSGTDTSTTDTATNIVAAIPNCQVGSCFYLLVVNGSGNTHTLALGSGVTAAAGVTVTLTTATTNAHTFLLRVTNVAAPALNIYSLGSAAS